MTKLPAFYNYMSFLMQSKYPVRLIIAGLCFFMAFPSFAQKISHVQGDILVQLKENESAEKLVVRLQNTSARQRAVQSRQITSAPMNIWLLNFDYTRIDEHKMLEQIRDDRDVLLAQKNHILYDRKTPDDPQFTSQWQYINDGSMGGLLNADLDIDLAWDLTTGGLTAAGDTIVICVIDDGIDTNHEDLANTLWKNNAEIPKNNIDDDGNGYVDDYLGWDTYNSDDNISRDGSHGTPVAGIVGAKGNNTIGVAGVNWDVKMMIVRGGGNEANALASYSYPYYFRKKYNETNGEEGAFVVATNASWGTDNVPASEAPIWCSFYDSLGHVGILNCGATTNSNTNVDEAGDLPTTCTSDYLISVTNIQRNDFKRESAGYGPISIDLGAYGEDTWTIRSNSNYGAFGGTSGATPHVTGAIGLIYALDCPKIIANAKKDPASVALAVKYFILNGVTPNQSLEGITVTEGRLNINNSVRLADQACDECPVPLSVSFSDVTDTSVLIDWSDETEFTDAILRYRVAGNPFWTQVNSPEKPYRLNGISACTEYEVQIKSICSNLESEFSGSRKFKSDGCCRLPAYINLDNDETEASFSWESILASFYYQVEYKTFEDNTWTINQVMDNSFEIEELAPCTAYLFRLKVLCSNGSNETDYSETIQFSTPCDICTDDAYCSFTGINSNSEWIERVQFNGIDNTSGQNEGGYGNYLGVYLTNVTQGNDYNITITPGFSFSEFDEYFKVYIDWNQDAIFDEDDELAFSPGEIQGKAEGTISVPEESVPGTTRMRIVMAFDKEPGSCANNSDFTFGEIEDYCITIKDPVSTNNIDELTKVNVYPNPFTDDFFVEIDSDISMDIQLQLYDMNGKLISSQKESIDIGNNILNIAEARLQSGVYILKVASSEGVLSTRVSKF